MCFPSAGTFSLHECMTIYHGYSWEINSNSVLSSHVGSVTQISSVIPKIFLLAPFPADQIQSGFKNCIRLLWGFSFLFVCLFVCLFSFPSLEQSSSTLSFINDSERLKSWGQLSYRTSRTLRVTFFMIRFRSDFPVRPLYRSHRIRRHIKSGRRWPHWTAWLMVMTASFLHFMWRHIFLLYSNLWCGHGMLYFFKLW